MRTLGRIFHVATALVGLAVLVAALAVGWRTRTVGYVGQWRADAPINDVPLAPDPLVPGEQVAFTCPTAAAAPAAGTAAPDVATLLAGLETRCASVRRYQRVSAERGVLEWTRWEDVGGGAFVFT